jgi:hypothetical protein
VVGFACCDLALVGFLPTGFVADLCAAFVAGLWVVGLATDGLGRVWVNFLPCALVSAISFVA